MIAALAPAVRANVRQFLGPDDPDVDDVVQEALIATLRYLQDDVEFEGDLARLAITIGRNRCRDLARKRRRWRAESIDTHVEQLPDLAATVLDDLDAADRRSLLLAALADLSDRCRDLLISRYLDDQSPEEICARLGIASRHAFYYRRVGCLRRLKIFYTKRVSGRS